jgi:hypothetical protein
MNFASDCATIMSKCAQDLSNPKDFANLPSKMTSEFNNLTQQTIEHNKKSMDSLIDSTNQYRQFGQQIGEDMMDYVNGSWSESKSTGSTSSKKVG